MKTETLIVAIVAAFIVVFIISREFTLWYFKINKTIKIKQAQLALMAKQYEQAGGILTEEEKSAIEKALRN